MTGIVGLDITADKFRKDFHSETKEKRRVILNSFGGSVSEGFEIYNIIKAYKGDIEIIMGAWVASIAAYIAMAVPKENRKAFKNSSFMLHEASSIAEGRARDFKIHYERLEGVNNIMADAIAEGMGFTREVARNIMQEDKYYIGWESLVDANIISDVIDPKEIDIPKKEENESQYLFLTGMMSELEKAQDATILKAKMYEWEEKMNADVKKSQADVFKAAAQLKLNEINPVITPVENKSKEDIKMKLDELLKANPEAKAEYDLILESAKGEGKAELMKAQNALGEDRKRIAKILTVAKAELHPETVAAIESDMQPGDFAIEMIAKQKELGDKAAEKQSPFAALVSKQTPKDQTKNAVEDMKTELDAFDAKLNKAKPKKGVK